MSNKWLWYPKRVEQEKFYMKCEIENKYPVYILSKGRYFRDKKYQAPKTCQYLDAIGVDYKVIIEEEEYDNYLKSIPAKRLVILPKEYLEEQHSKGNFGGIPARNYIHKINCDEDNFAYWCLDDNMSDYYWIDNNERYRVRSPLVFRMLEDIMDLYGNLYLMGHQYKSFALPTDYTRIVQTNTRVYSSILIRTDIPPLDDSNDIWRGKYNEDTDLSLRILKMGLPTLITYNMNVDKETTGEAKGGNTDSIYAEDGNGSGTLKSLALMKDHSDCVKMVKRYGRDHHLIDLKKFEKNKFEPFTLEEGIFEETNSLGKNFRFQYTCLMCKKKEWSMCWCCNWKCGFCKLEEGETNNGKKYDIKIFGDDRKEFLPAKSYGKK